MRPRPESSREAEDRTGSDPLILLVDDDRASLDLLTAYLDGSGAGWSGPVTARRGCGSPARCVLTSSSWTSGSPASTDGRCSPSWRRDPATAGIPVVIASVVDERPQGLSLGAAEYLLKPVSREDLLDALGRVGALPARGSDQLAPGPP